jgi:hypothetical protein
MALWKALLQEISATSAPQGFTPTNHLVFLAGVGITSELLLFAFIALWDAIP